jgi:hypothetical protein
MNDAVTGKKLAAVSTVRSADSTERFLDIDFEIASSAASIPKKNADSPLMLAWPSEPR